MSETNGLRAILGTPETLHSIAPPPERGDYPTAERYVAAVDAWWLTTHTWKTARAYRAAVCDAQVANESQTDPSEPHS